MQTIKLPVQFNSIEDKLFISNLQRIYSSAFRYAFNRFKKDGLNQKEVRALCKDKFQGSLGSWFLQNAITEAQYSFKKFEETKITPIFAEAKCNSRIGVC